MRRRAGQTTVEVMLVISVITVGMVGVGWWLVGGESGIVAGLESFSEGAKKAYVDPDNTP